MPRLASVTVALVVAASTGCSFISVRRAPSLPLGSPEPIRCTTSRSAPNADLITGLAAGALGVAAFATYSCSDTRAFGCFHEGPQKLGGGFLLVTGAVALASSVYGYTATKHCDEVQRWQFACEDGRAEACEALLGPSWRRFARPAEGPNAGDATPE